MKKRSSALWINEKSLFPNSSLTQLKSKSFMYGIVSWSRIGIPLLLLLPISLFSQSATIDSVQDLARKNYPAIRQKDLLKKTALLTVSNLNKNYLPQLSVNGQASYQSEVTSIDVTLPG